MDVPPAPPAPTTPRPWMRLLRGPGMAMDPKKLVLAAVGLGLLRLGWELLDRLFARAEGMGGGFHPHLLYDDIPGLQGVLEMAAERITEPYRLLIAPFQAVFAVGRGPVAFLHAALAAVWAVTVWGIIGGAIARIAAVQLVSGERLGIFPALGFARKKALALIGTPLCPMIGLGFFACLCALMGLLYQIPGPIGVTVAGLFAFLPLLAGLVMALIVVGLAVGWPMMVATVAVEAEDVFDALSRSYSYTYQRGGRYAAMIAVSWLFGTVGLAVVWMFAALVVHMARWGLAFGAPDGRLLGLFAGNPDFGANAAGLHSMWLYLVRLLAQGWIYAYFWTSATIIYFLLRLDVDGTPLDDLGGRDDEIDDFAPSPETPEKSPTEGEVA